MWMLWAGHDESLIDPVDVVSVALTAWSEVKITNSAIRKKAVYAHHLLEETLIDDRAMLVGAMPNICCIWMYLEGDKVLTWNLSNVWYSLLEVNLSWSTPSREWVTICVLGLWIPTAIYIPLTNQ